MKIHVLQREQWIPRSVEELWPFFRDPSNLEAITPTFLKFRVVRSTTAEVEHGSEIDYRLKLHGVPISWRSRIVIWDPPRAFVDMQIRGPYRLWHHEHRFVPEGGGTRSYDIVQYAHWGGDWVHRKFVRPDLEQIFDYRRDRIAEIFPERVRAESA